MDNTELSPFDIPGRYSSSKHKFAFRGFASSLNHRRRNDDENGASKSILETISNYHYPHKRRRRKGLPFSCNTCSTALLCASFLVWFLISFVLPSHWLAPPSSRPLPIRDRVRARVNQRKQWSANTSIFDRFKEWRASFSSREKTNRKKTHDSEALLPGCEPLDWHSLHYPTCNIVHEQRLGEYLASGLWRSVWLPQHHEETSVLKVMQREHKVDHRNWDRHRRDALVMEQLTASPFVTDVYGYCGNSVVTERASPPLDALLYDAVEFAPLRQRVVWARDVARGVAELHAKGIVHADLQVKQFLSGPNGMIKINDFNRCRFMARRTQTTINATNTTEHCPFHIPTAPGKQRAPEEYKNEYLTEKLDIYSLANILWALWAGQKPWDRYSSAETKRLVKKGHIPPSPFSPETSVGMNMLWNITAASYALDPTQRPTAQTIVDVLDHVLRVEMKEDQ